MKHYLKIVTIFFLRILLRAFYVFPVKKNRILFSSFEGKNYGCNPKYIYEYMYKHWGDSYEYVWCLNDSSSLPLEYKATCVRFLSMPHLYYLLTSKAIISNMGIEPMLPKRKKQLFINTWHGGGAYKIGKLTARFISKPRRFSTETMHKIRAKMTNYVISSCSAFTECNSVKWGIDKKQFVPIGMPRNDLFFSQADKQSIRNKITSLYHINSDKALVLYAPTFRGEYRESTNTDLQIKPQQVCASVKERFGKEAVMLYRCHIGTEDLKLKDTVDVSGYQDKQELLLIADVFITDYSSSIWDYSFTGKPGFLFTPDLQEYKEEVDFHTPIDLWPYPYAQTVEELCEMILKYDEIEALHRIHAHHTLLGSYENGNATSEICKIIKESSYIDKK